MQNEETTKMKNEYVNINIFRSVRWQEKTCANLVGLPKFKYLATSMGMTGWFLSQCMGQNGRPDMCKKWSILNGQIYVNENELTSKKDKKNALEGLEPSLLTYEASAFSFKLQCNFW